MAKTVAIGLQNFKKIITNDCFYIDKTDFIREWQESADEVTLIARPRRFGKTLNMSMLDTGKFITYWANTSSNSLAGKLIREGNTDIQDKFKILLERGTIESRLDEQIVYNQLGQKKDAIWSLLLASDYLKALLLGDKKICTKPD